MQFAQTSSGEYVSDAFAIRTEELEPLLVAVPENTVRQRIAEHRFVAIDLSAPGTRLEFWPEEEEGEWTMLVRAETEDAPDASPPEVEPLVEGKEPVRRAADAASPTIG